MRQCPRFLLASSVAWIPTLAVVADEPAILSPRLAALKVELAAGTHEAQAAFWREIEAGGTPLVERSARRQMHVTFLWRAETAADAINVTVAGPFNQDDPPAARQLVRLAGSDVWHRTYTLDASARFSYSLAWPAGRSPHPEALRRQIWEGMAYELFADPLCRRSITGVFFDEDAPYSYAEGPDAPPEPWLRPRDGIDRGRVVTQPFRSEVLGTTRDITVYLPHGHSRDAGRYPFVLLFDGRSYLRSAEISTQLDNLIAERAIPPVVAILVGRTSREQRNRELPPNAAFMRFVVGELVPAMRREYGLSSSPGKAVIGGASYGALAAAAIAREHPKVFGGVLSQSGSYWWHPSFSPKEDDAFRQQMGWLPRTFVSANRLPLRFHLEVGLWEGSSMVLPNRFFRDLLLARGYEVDYQEFVGGHDYVNWRGSLAPALVYLLGKPEG